MVCVVSSLGIQFTYSARFTLAQEEKTIIDPFLYFDAVAYFPDSTNDKGKKYDGAQGCWK